MKKAKLLQGPLLLQVVCDAKLFIQDKSLGHGQKPQLGFQARTRYTLPFTLVVAIERKGCIFADLQEKRSPQAKHSKP